MTIEAAIKYYYDKAMSYDDYRHSVAVGLSLALKLTHPDCKLMDEDMELQVAGEMAVLKLEGIIDGLTQRQKAIQDLVKFKAESPEDWQTIIKSHNPAESYLYIIGVLPMGGLGVEEFNEMLREADNAD